MSGLSVWPFVLLSVLILVSALWVATLPNLFHAALSLGLVLLGIAGLFILLEAEFLAFVQILIYVGAILTLVIFAIMLTAKLQGGPQVSASRQRPAALVSGALFAVLASATRALAGAVTAAADPVTLPQLGRELVTTLILPFEVISVVFVAVMVGAIAVAASKAPSRSSSTPAA